MSISHIVLRIVGAFAVLLVASVAGAISGCTSATPTCLPGEEAHVYCPAGTIWVSEHNPSCWWECDPTSDTTG